MKKILVCLLVYLLVCLLIVPMAGAAEKEKILVPMSSQSEMGLANHTKTPIGFFLNEFAVPAQYLAERGYEIVIATPSGNVPVMDKGSASNRFFGGDEAAFQNALKFFESQKPVSLKAAVDDGLEQYAGIFVPGGHSPMTDLTYDPELGKALHYFHEKGKPTAFICHGPAAALSTLPHAAEYRQALIENNVAAAREAAKNWPYAGYRMTALSDAEEWPGEVRLGTQMPFHLEQALQIAGATMVVSTPGRSHVEIDRELITGQNPASDKALAEAMLNALRK